MSEPFDREQVRIAFQDRLGYEARPFQVEAAKEIHDGNDLFLIAPTGYGKSGVFTSIFCPQSVSSSSMIVIITPLKALQKQQAEKDPHATFINAENKTDKLLEEIKDKKYRRVYMGPEQLQCDNVRKIVRSEEWAKDLLAYVIDEAHVVIQWGKTFRPIYATLAEIRHLNSRKVPILAMTATLPLDIFQKLKHVLEVNNPSIINLGSARPNIYIRVRKFNHGVKSFLDVWEELPALHELAKNGTWAGCKRLINHSHSLFLPLVPPEMIPKSIVYVNDKRLVHDLYTDLRGRMCAEEHRDGIQYHHASATEFHRNAVERGLADGTYRLVVATDSLGMGQDIPDISKVVQVGAGDSLPAMVQRAGRAGRNGRLAAEAVVLFEPGLVEGSGKRKRGALRDANVVAENDDADGDGGVDADDEDEGPDSEEEDDAEERPVSRSIEEGKRQHTHRASV
jgi:ATP-dependent DNA helicase RecQ